jgi:outer membrane protein
MLCAATCGAAAPACAETLSDAISLAYETNPTLRAARANQRATDEEYPQAKAGLRPSVQALGQVAYNESHVSAFVPGAESTSGAFIQFTQPVYTGGRVTNAIDAATADVLAGREGLRQTEIQLLENVIKAYADVRRDQIQLDIEYQSVALLKRQLEEATTRFDVGEATKTDTAQARARLAQEEALAASEVAQLTASRAEYVAAVGQNPGDLAPEPPISQLLPANADAMLDAAEKDNPQVLQASYVERASAARLAEAKSGHLPTIALQGSVGYAGGINQLGLPANNPFANFAEALTVQATATIPIYNGGLTSSQVRQAAERNNVDRNNIDATRRQVVQTASSAWAQLLAARDNVKLDQDQVDADEIAFEGTREEEQQDLRTTLDVLNAERELMSAKVALAGAQHDEYLAATAVLGATGALDVGIFAPNAQRYDPADNFKHVRHAGAIAPWEAALETIDRAAPAAGPPPPAPPRSPAVKQ